MLEFADVAVLFQFNGTRRTPIIDGYRPAHLVMDGYLASGIHHYYTYNPIPPDGKTEGTITFISPQDYPHCLWIGKKVNIQEGDRVVGVATITKIYNRQLQIEDQNNTRPHTE